MVYNENMSKPRADSAILRVHPAIHREAKAAAARAGCSLTLFVQQALMREVERQSRLQPRRKEEGVGQ